MALKFLFKVFLSTIGRFMEWQYGALIGRGTYINKCKSSDSKRLSALCKSINLTYDTDQMLPFPWNNVNAIYLRVACLPVCDIVSFI